MSRLAHNSCECGSVCVVNSRCVTRLNCMVVYVDKVLNCACVDLCDDEYVFAER